MNSQQKEDVKKLSIACVTFAIVLYVGYFFMMDGYIRQNIDFVSNITSLQSGRTFIIRFKNRQLNYRVVSIRPCPSETTILMLSMSRRYGFENRKVLRETWINDMRPNETIRFLIADAKNGENKIMEKQLIEEQAAHGDLVIFHGFNDTYYDLHLKWYAAMQWQQAYCANTKWVLKVDDDVIVHLGRLEHWIEHKFRPILTQNPLTIFGNIIQGIPIRDMGSKWYVPESVYPYDRYPNFTSGTVYLTTSDTLAKLLLYAPMVKEFYLEDVLYTGMVAELANVTRSYQQWHFLWFDQKLDQQQYNCEGGMPRAITIWGAESVEQFKKFYRQLQSIKCQ